MVIETVGDATLHIGGAITRSLLDFAVGARAAIFVFYNLLNLFNLLIRQLVRELPLELLDDRILHFFILLLWLRKRLVFHLRRFLEHARHLKLGRAGRMVLGFELYEFVIGVEFEATLL